MYSDSQVVTSAGPCRISLWNSAARMKETVSTGQAHQEISSYGNCVLSYS
jgi:hypothetical protein